MSIGKACQLAMHLEFNAAGIILFFAGEREGSGGEERNVSHLTRAERKQPPPGPS